MTTLFKKIPQKKVSDRVFDQVRDLIANGRLLPGDRLPPERELTGMLEVSRSSVREAIRKLECLGFVEQRQGEGTFIRSATAGPMTDLMQELIKEDNFIFDLMEIRAVLETWGAARAADRASAGDIAAMVAEEAFFWLDAPVKRVSAPDTPPPFAPVMEQFYVPSVERVVDAVKSLF